MPLRRLAAAIALSFAATLPAFADSPSTDAQAEGIAAFAAKAREPVLPVLVEIDGAPAFADKRAPRFTGR